MTSAKQGLGIGIGVGVVVVVIIAFGLSIQSSQSYREPSILVTSFTNQTCLHACGENNTASCDSFLHGFCLFSSKVGVDLQFRKELSNDSKIIVSQNSSNTIFTCPTCITTDVVYSSVNAKSSNYQIYANTTNNVFYFRILNAGTGILLSNTSNTITISNTGVISGSCSAPISCNGVNPLSISCSNCITSSQTGSNTTTLNTNIPCSYLVFINGTSYQAENCSSGKIDFSTTDASTTIQDALNSISSKGGEVFIKQGFYRIFHPINFTGTGETIRGEGVTADFGTTKYGTELILGNSSNVNMFQYVGSTTILFPVITDMYMQGNQAHNTKGNGTYFGGSNSQQLVKDFELTQVYVDGFPQFGISSNNAHDYKITHGAIEHMGIGGTGKQFGIFIKTGDSIRIQDIIFRFAGIQIGCNTVGGLNPDNLCGNKFAKGAVIGNNKIEGGNITIENSATVVNNNIFDSMTAPFNNGFSSINLRFNDTGTIINTNILNGSSVANNGVIIDNSSSSQVLITNNEFSQYKLSTISDSGTNTLIRNNVPTSINNDLIAGSGITITQGLKSNTIANSGVTSITCVNTEFSCSGSGGITLTGKWQQLCETTLLSANSTIKCALSSSTNYLYIDIISNTTSGSTGINIRFNSDSGNNYANRLSINGGADSTNVNQNLLGLTNGATVMMHSFTYCSNLQKSPKICNSTGGDAGTSGAGNAPNRIEVIGKWQNTISVINVVTVTASGGFNYNIGSEIVVWGSN